MSWRIASLLSLFSIPAAPLALMSLGVIDGQVMSAATVALLVSLLCLASFTRFMADRADGTFSPLSHLLFIGSAALLLILHAI